MRKLTVLGTSLLLLMACLTACRSSQPAKDVATEPTGAADRQVRAELTPENNPTTLAGRGEPSLDDPVRPAAWIYVDGLSGRFAEREGNPQLEWVIDDPVGSTPTFRVESYGPLLGTPRNFRYLLKTVDSVDGSEVAYAVAAVKKTFVTGREYPLLDPGDNFIIRNWSTGDILRRIAPLAPGTYLMAGGVTNSSTGTEAAAVTYFTVGEP